MLWLLNDFNQEMGHLNVQLEMFGNDLQVWEFTLCTRLLCPGLLFEECLLLYK